MTSDSAVWHIWAAWNFDVKLRAVYLPFSFLRVQSKPKKDMASLFPLLQIARHISEKKTLHSVENSWTASPIIIMLLTQTSTCPKRNRKK